MGETINERLQISYHNAQSSICLVAYAVLEQVMLDFFWKIYTGKMIDTQIVKFFDSEIITWKLSKVVQKSNKFITPMETFLKDRGDTAFDTKQKYSIPWKQEPFSAAKRKGAKMKIMNHHHLDWTVTAWSQ